MNSKRTVAVWGRARRQIEEEAIGRRHEARRQWKARLLRHYLVFLVALPTLVGTIYFGLWATPRYESQAHLIVRSVNSQRSTGLEVLFRAMGISRSQDDADAVQDYIRSRDALRALESRLPIRTIYGPSGADLFSRFPHFWLGDSFEKLYWYYLDHVSVVPDSDTGIITLSANAFRAEDAKAIVSDLVAQAEAMVNRMNDRLEADALQSAEAAVTMATSDVLKAQDDITRFRNQQMMVDPSKNSVALLETITSLSADLDRAMAQIVESNSTSPSNPAILPLRARADALTHRIQVERERLAGTDKALADKVSQYEHLTLLKSLADKKLAVAVASLESARVEARRQHVYVEQVVAPNIPDEPLLPRRLRSIVTIFVMAGAFASMIWLISVGVKEHRA